MSVHIGSSFGNFENYHPFLVLWGMTVNVEVLHCAYFRVIRIITSAKIYTTQNPTGVS